MTDAEIVPESLDRIRYASLVRKTQRHVQMESRRRVGPFRAKMSQSDSDLASGHHDDRSWKGSGMSSF